MRYITGGVTYTNYTVQKCLHYIKEIARGISTVQYTVVKHILSTMPNLYTIFRTFSRHATLLSVMNNVAIYLWTPFISLITPLNKHFSGVETYMYNRVLKITALIATAWQ